MPLGSFRLNGLAKKIGSLVFKNRYDYDFTPTAGTVISTTSPKFGTGSLRLPADTDTLKTTYPHTIIPDDSSWTVEGWVKFDNSNYSGFKYAFGSPNISISLRGFSGGFVAIEYYVTDRNGANPVNWNGDIAPAATVSGTWYHWAVVFHNDYFYIFGSGVLVSFRGPYTSTAYTLFGTSAVTDGVTIGGTLTGNFDEIRVSKVARYLSAFTPPSAPFVNDSATLALYHADGTDNSKVFLDDNSAFNTVSTVAFQASTTTLATNITIPATTQAGDVAFLFDTSTTVTDVVPTGWTPISKVTTTGIRTNVSYRILTSGDPNTAVAGMGGTVRKVMVVYRPNVPATNINAITIGSQATTSTPTNQTLVGEAGPMIAFAVYGKTTSTTPTRGWSVGSPQEYSSVSVQGVYVKALITNSGTPADTVISMTDAGTNTLQTFRVKFL